jgi:hypothetical protein
LAHFALLAPAFSILCAGEDWELVGVPLHNLP